MNRYTKYISVLFVCLVWGGQAFSQFELSVPAITKQEFFNPAYNSYKEYVSLNVMSRQQWYNAGVDGPKVLAANAYIPLGKRALGLGTTIVSEEVGLRSVNTFYLSLSKKLRLGTDAHLALGVGMGVQGESYDRKKMIHYPEVNFNRVELSQTNPAFTMGMMAMVSNFFMGISSNITVSKNDFDYKYLTGFDGTIGMVKAVNEDFVYKLALVSKYYIQNQIKAGQDGKLDNGYVSPILDLSFHCFLFSSIWLGTSHRLNEAQTFTLSARFGKVKKITVGYTYEKGIGSGLNRYDTQGIFLSYNFLKKSSRKKAYFKKRSVLYDTPLSEYLY
ncbi:type IX secretion system membrane protein PorP/SprF [Ancylomarina sp. DW003]|nr:type IX secretion system membrane protein PorP/SprF [Ancylomarina sp. DW003]MDE5421155.1 type IX secretion system membrane protein PorP/SprF [Ancylomarina sp. DW003]